MDFLERLVSNTTDTIATIGTIIIIVLVAMLVVSGFSRYLGIIRDFVIIRMVPRMVKNMANAAFSPPTLSGMRGKTKEQKKIIRYFNRGKSRGRVSSIIPAIIIIWITQRMIFHNFISFFIWIIFLCIGIFIYYKLYKKISGRNRITDSSFDELLDAKAQEVASQIEERALEVHGMDADEVKEIPPILAENYYGGSRYFKTFKDGTFRASEYQMTYLMFSNKQMYAYSYVFDMTSAQTNEQTKEYFYRDITNVEVYKKQIEFHAFRVPKKEYIFGGIACIIVGIIIGFLGSSPGMKLEGYLVFSNLLEIVGLIILITTILRGFFRRLVDNLILRLTVAGDEFECSMNPDNMAAIQGMKAKIREKKE